MRAAGIFFLHCKWKGKFCIASHSLKVQNWSSALITRKITQVHSDCQKIACVASVSNWVTAQKLEREQKKWKGEGVGRKGNACSQTPRFWKTSLEISWFVSFVNWQLINPTENEQITRLRNLLSSLKHAPRDCKTVIKRSFTIKEGWNSKRLLRNFLFFIVKWYFESSVAFSQLKPCQNVAKKLFVRNNSLCLLWVLPSGCSP